MTEFGKEGGAMQSPFLKVWNDHKEAKYTGYVLVHLDAGRPDRCEEFGEVRKVTHIHEDNPSSPLRDSVRANLKSLAQQK